MDTSTSPTSSTSSSTTQSPPLVPLRNPKYRHISRSAAKRESVQMLGSIKDLQLHFSRAGLVEHRPGAGAGLKGTSLGSLGEDSPEDEENRPPSSLGSSRNDKKEKEKERRPYKEVELPRIDPENARREAKNMINDIRAIWGLSLPLPISPSTIANTAASNNSGGLPSSKSLYFPINLDDFGSSGGDNEDAQSDMKKNEIRTSEDIQNALVQTAQSIRRIRFLALSISHHNNNSGRKVSNSSLFPSRLGGAGKLRSSLSTPSRPSGTGTGHGPLRTISGSSINMNPSDRKSCLGKSDEVVNNKQAEDELGELRKAALEVLTALRELEERLRVQHNSGDGEEDELRNEIRTPNEDNHDRPFSPIDTEDDDLTDPMVMNEPENYDSEEDELYNPNHLAQNSENEIKNKLLTNWEDRILFEKRNYKDLQDNDAWEFEARNTRNGIGKWVGVVENLFVFNRNDQDGRGVIIEDWAKGGWEGNELERLHSFLLSNLPLDLSLRIPSIQSDNLESTLLSRLSDGYILIHAYNSSLLRSSKPWGFIPDGDVHDTLSSTSSSSGQNSPSKDGRMEKEWTFRKVGNLTCFGAALRHRYQLPITMPTANLPVPPVPPKSHSRPRPSIITSNPSIKSSGMVEEKIEFDPMIIAKKSPGWERMLSGLVARWIDEVGKEIRSCRGEIDEILGNGSVGGGEEGGMGEKVGRGGMF